MGSRGQPKTTAAIGNRRQEKRPPRIHTARKGSEVSQEKKF